MASGKKRKHEFYRLTIDLDKPTYVALKTLADEQERTASKQAKIILQNYFTTSE